MPASIKKEPIKKTTHAPREHKAAAHAEVAKSVVAKAARYAEAVGRRKTAIARVRITPGTGKVFVNGMDAAKYFALPRLAVTAIAPLAELKLKGSYDMSAKVRGGGIHAQAEAIRLGVARAVVLKNPEWKKRLSASGYMTRDSRMVERKKYGKLKARRSPQWAKR
jgi:small subunit ribosomal protein S9